MHYRTKPSVILWNRSLYLRSKHSPSSPSCILESENWKSYTTIIGRCLPWLAWEAFKVLNLSPQSNAMSASQQRFSKCSMKEQLNECKPMLLFLLLPCSWQNRVPFLCWPYAQRLEWHRSTFESGTYLPYVVGTRLSHPYFLSAGSLGHYIPNLVTVYLDSI